MYIEVISENLRKRISLSTSFRSRRLPIILMSPSNVLCSVEYSENLYRHEEWGEEKIYEYEGKYSVGGDRGDYVPKALYGRYLKHMYTIATVLSSVVDKVLEVGIKLCRCYVDTLLTALVQAYSVDVLRYIGS